MVIMYNNNSKHDIMTTFMSSVIQTRLISADVEGYRITTINSEDFRGDVPRMSIQIPSELVGLFAASSGRDGGEIRVISALYYNIEDLFPSGRPGMNG